MSALIVPIFAVKASVTTVLISSTLACLRAKTSVTVGITLLTVEMSKSWAVFSISSIFSGKSIRISLPVSASTTTFPISLLILDKIVPTFLASAYISSIVLSRLLSLYFSP